VAKLCEHGNETSVSTKGGAFFDKLWELSATQKKLCSVQFVSCRLSGSEDGSCVMELAWKGRFTRRCHMSLLQCLRLAGCSCILPVYNTCGAVDSYVTPCMNSGT